MEIDYAYRGIGILNLHILYTKKTIKILLIIIVFLIITPDSNAQPYKNSNKPWTYWWWMGSAVNKSDINWQLKEFAKAGLGGVHIIPIYGVKGYENYFIDFLSEDWLELVNYTIEQAKLLDLGVDITLGTGWPYGGKWIDSNAGAKKLLIKEYNLYTTSHIIVDLDSVILNNNYLNLVGLLATNTRGESLNLSSNISENKVDKDVNESVWKLSFFGIANTNQKVKRAAPGGEGLVLDYFEREAVMTYLNHFDSIFNKSSYSLLPRAYYHDSYEVFGADWTLNFTNRFKELRGYDLGELLPVLIDEQNPQRPLFIHDIRETISDLVFTEFAETWTNWCKEYNVNSRYQAHGSPSNLLDLYALSDIPETESFGCSGFTIPNLKCDPDFEEDRFGRPSPLMMKFASSPAHLFHKQLVSSETATWLGNHFKVSLSQVKPQVDELFVSGINHVFYHGIAYSPNEEVYPGWLFYASTNFGQTSHFWDELPLLNSYINECQHLLQNSSPDNDILLYFPIDDLWTKYPGEPLLTLDVHKHSKWFSKTAFGITAKLLWDNGYCFDYISDKQINQLTIGADSQLSLKSESSYSLIVVPSIDYINKKTYSNLDSLAKNGVKIIFVDRLPERFAGILGESSPVEEISELKSGLMSNNNTVISDNLLIDMGVQDINQENIKLLGLDFIRKKNKNGFLYFITNIGNQYYEDSVSLSRNSNFIEIYDPQNQNQGFLKSSNKFLLQLPPGKSCFIKTYEEKPLSDPWIFSRPFDTLILDNEWTVDFHLDSKKNVKSRYNIDTLESWIEWVDEELKSFCGKATYSSYFTLKNYEKSSSYKLVLDDINETAEITINGINCGTIWTLPNELEIPGTVLKERNTIQIKVQNLSANKIREIDRQGRKWKKFYDINFVDIQYQPFDASGWDYVPSGLSGNIKLIKNK